MSSTVLECLHDGKNALVSSLFHSEGQSKDEALIASMASINNQVATSRNKSSRMTVTKRFTMQLDLLIKQLNNTEPLYIRCIKPNDDKQPGVVDSQLLNQQLTYSGVFEAVKIMQSGYPYRLPFAEFIGKYHGIALNFHIETSPQVCHSPVSTSLHYHH